MSESYIVINGELYHHGIKGQKWGIRRYQYADGSLTPAGKKRYSSVNGQNGSKRAAIITSMKVKEFVDKVKTRITGKQYVDTYLKKGITLSRIQSSDVFNKFAFYATYKNSDSNKYLGLYGKQLISGAKKAALKAEKQATISGSEADAPVAKTLRDKVANAKIFQLKLEAIKKLKVPSDDNASDITANLLKEKEFKDNVIASIRDSKLKMRRPQQQMLLQQALSALSRNPEQFTTSEKLAVYKAFNLSLTYHNSQQIAAQNRFYGELKKKGYNALLDYNDKEYSSYHAKRPMIVFDVDSVKLQAVTQAAHKVAERLHTKYTIERIAKESVASSLGLIGRFADKTVAECRSYIDRRTNQYLNT
jgi:hypothetical protein